MRTLEDGTMATPTGLAANIEANERTREQLEEEHLRRYAVFHDAKLADAFDTGTQAITAELKRFGVAPYLIRRVPSSGKMSPIL